MGKFFVINPDPDVEEFCGPYDTLEKAKDEAENLLECTWETPIIIAESLLRMRRVEIVTVKYEEEEINGEDV